MPAAIYIWDIWKILSILSMALNLNLLSLLGGIEGRGKAKSDWQSKKIKVYTEKG